MNVLSNLLQKITDSFVDMNLALKHKTVAEYGSRAISVKKIEGESPYYYVQRKGNNHPQSKDSVAFILIDLKNNRIGTLKQWHGPLIRFQTGCFTGSIDKAEKSIPEIVIDEVIEEAGYQVSENDLKFVCKKSVSGNTNEEVNIYIVNITGKEFKGIEPENIWEQNTETVWYDLDSKLDNVLFEDWKADIAVRYVMRTNMAVKSILKLRY